MRLTQRLKAPPISIAHHVFGGHALGLTNEAWQVLDKVFEVDYMGSAEYEWGRLPKTMGALVEAAKDKELTAFKFSIPRKEVSRHPSRTIKNKKPLPEEPTEPVTFYVICRTSETDSVKKAIHNIASGKESVRDGSRIEGAMDPINRLDAEVRGWLDHEGFFFFLDREMWLNACDWFFTEPEIKELASS